MIKYRMWILWILAAIMVGCSDDETITADNSSRQYRKVALLLSVSGLGDNGYNDCIAQGVMEFTKSTNTDLSLLSPGDVDEARDMFEAWIEHDGLRDSSVLIIDNTYEAFISDNVTGKLGKGSRILVVDGMNGSYPAGVSSVRICRYGASYLAGAMSQEFDAIVMMAMPDFPILEEAKNGFLDGYNKYKAEGVSAEVVYLADDATGFAMPDKAHHLLSEIADDQMIFPLMGGSIVGVVNYLNHDMFALPLLIGMDTDMSGLSSRIPFSLFIHIDLILNDYLDNWIKGEDWEPVKTYSLRDGDIEIIVCEDFFKYLNLWDERYDEDEFENYKSIYIQEAIDIENDYLKKQKWL
ncbi:MAG: hypothetical protein J6C10_01825 [Prevotella sp.]|nr:hypothetical protein [Prevotella sp.]MBO5058230.1 hypothetical protein [Prevotella sp.]